MADDRDPPKRSWLQSTIEALFAIDARSLAAFRIALGLLLLGDLADRARDLQAHYTDFGSMPRSVAMEKLLDPWNISVHLASGKMAFELGLFGLAAAFAFALLIGYRSRVASVVSWFLLCSLHGRNPLVLQAGDVLFRLLLFWSMFVPLGERWSVDVLRRRPGHPSTSSALSFGTAGLLLQVAFVYWSAAALKTDACWRVDGTGLARALAIEQLVTPLGLWLRGYPDVMRALSFGTIWLEGFGPFLAFSPVFTVPLRLVAIAGFVGFHLGIAATMPLGTFQYICIAAWLAFLPAAFWDRLSSWAPALAPLARRRTSTLPLVPDTMALFFIVYVFLWNLRETDPVKFRHWPPRASNWIAQLLRLDQRWNMFAPKPLGEDGWYVIPGRLKNGQELDLFRDGAPVDWAKPLLVSATYKNQRWQKYMMNLWLVSYSAHRLPYGRYLCRNWNSSHSGAEQLESFEIHFMKEEILGDGSKRPAEKTLLWKHRCFE